jgi:Putative Zn-dependent protease, contains TPR repeats
MRKISFRTATLPVQSETSTQFSNAIRRFWPALYVRAQIYSHEGKYDLALKDCNEALRQDRSVVEAALLRANINFRLGKYAEALKEYDYLVSLHPRNVTLARAERSCLVSRDLPERVVS